MDSASDFSSSSETLSVISEDDVIPTPDVFTDKVQPEDEHARHTGTNKSDGNKDLLAPGPSKVK